MSEENTQDIERYVSKRRMKRFWDEGIVPIKNNQADAYDTSKTYAVGEMCIRDRV